MVNNFLLEGDKFMPKMYLKQPGFTYVFVVHLLKTKKKFKNLYRQKIQIIFTRMILIKLVLNMIWLMVNITIWLKEHNQTKFQETKLLNFQVIYNVMGIREDYPQ